MELRTYLQKNDMVLYYIDGEAAIHGGFSHRRVASNDVVDLVPFASPDNIEFKFGSEYDYCRINKKFRSIIDSDEGFYEFIDRVTNGTS